MLEVIPDTTINQRMKWFSAKLENISFKFLLTLSPPSLFCIEDHSVCPRAGRGEGGVHTEGGSGNAPQRLGQKQQKADFLLN